MDTQINSKKYQKKPNVANDKAMAKLNSKNKKKKQRKSALKGDAKDSDPSPEVQDALEIEGVRALDQTGYESDSSTQERTEKPLDTPVPKNEDKPRKEKQHRKSSIGSPASPVVNSLAYSMTNMQVTSKQKSGSSRGIKAKGSKSGNQTGAKNMKKNSSTNDLKRMNNKTEQKCTESLRWENQLSDSEEERERIKMYKMNRRKRYLAYAQAQGLGWTSKYHSNGSPLSEDSGIETHEQEHRLSIHDTHPSHVAISDFSSLKHLGPSQTVNSNSLVEC